MTTESFVTVSGAGGISAKQTVFQNSNENADAQTINNTGWADTGGKASIDITLSDSYDYQSRTVALSFAHQSDLDASSNTIGSYSAVDQTLTETSQTTISQAGGRDEIRFVTDRRVRAEWR